MIRGENGYCRIIVIGWLTWFILMVDGLACVFGSCAV